MEYKFTKMNGLGNDFIILDCVNQPAPENPEDFAVKMCDRHHGIGADGILLVLPSEVFDIRMRIINSDGTYAQMCGNGIRCFAAYVYENNIVKKTSMKVETDAGVIKPKLIFDEEGNVEKVEVDMGLPRLDTPSIPVNIPGGCARENAIAYPHVTTCGELKLNCVSMGNPHTVTFWKNLDEVPFSILGPELEKDPMFPEKTNVEFVEVVNKNKIRVRVFERGCGETLACGTGACASTVAAVMNDLTERDLSVELSGGVLHCLWDENDHVIMTGPVAKVAEGTCFYN